MNAADSIRNSRLTTLKLLIDDLTKTRDVNEFVRRVNQTRDTRTHELPWTVEEIAEVACSLGYYGQVQEGWSAQTMAQMFIGRLVSDALYGCFSPEGEPVIQVTVPPRRREGTSPKAVAKLRELCRKVQETGDVNSLVAEITWLRTGMHHDTPWTWADVQAVYQEYDFELGLHPDLSDEAALWFVLMEVTASVIND